MKKYILYTLILANIITCFAMEKDSNSLCRIHGSTCAIAIAKAIEKNNILEQEKKELTEKICTLEDLNEGLSRHIKKIVQEKNNTTDRYTVLELEHEQLRKELNEKEKKENMFSELYKKHIQEYQEINDKSANLISRLLEENSSISQEKMEFDALKWREKKEFVKTQLAFQLLNSSFKQGMIIDEDDRAPAVKLSEIQITNFLKSLAKDLNLSRTTPAPPNSPRNQHSYELNSMHKDQLGS